MTIIPDIKFYDTCSLLLAGESIFESGEKFIISSITLKELEIIKTSSNKDSDVKYNARLLLHLLDEHKDKYYVIIHKSCYEEVIISCDLEVNNDTKILSDAIACNDGKSDFKVDFIDRVIFVTNDLSLKATAGLFFGDKMIESVPEDNDSYTGYKELYCPDEKLAEFYGNLNYNHFDLKIGEYLIIKNKDNEAIDVKAWNGTTHRNVKYESFDSIYFGRVKPYEKDIYQRILFDSLTHNKITMIKGPAGSGKTFISLSCLMSKLQKGELDRIIIFCNTVATANAARLGYLPGTKDEKLLDSQIGNLLTSKFGGRVVIERLINEEKLILLPFSDLRGYDTNDMRAGIYISEAQNLDRALMKLALSRVGEDCICIIDGDDKAQVDDIHFSGNNNGMKRASKIYRGSDIYGEVTLVNIHRSKIAELAQLI